MRAVTHEEVEKIVGGLAYKVGEHAVPGAPP